MKNYQYEPQVGDSTIDVAIGLLEEAMELLEGEASSTPEVKHFTKRAMKFIEEESNLS